MEQIEFLAMGSRMFAALDTPTTRAAAILAQVPAWFEEWETRLSRFRQDSELCQLNRRANAPTVVSEVLWAAWDAAWPGTQMSDGLVVPTMLDALEATGYDRTFEAVSAAQTVGGPPAATVAPAWRATQDSAHSRIVCLPPGVHLDFGGIANAWAADQVLVLSTSHSIASHMRSDLQFVGR